MFLLLTTTAAADSDGYFCIGPHYLAYETRLGADDTGHSLHIVRLAEDGTVRRARRTIPDFQVHGMSCEADIVMLDGWDATYEIDLVHPVDPRWGRHKPGELLKGYARMNLAQWNRAAGENRTQRLALWGRAMLEIINGKGLKPCEHTVLTRVVGTDAPYVLLDRTFERNCG